MIKTIEPFMGRAWVVVRDGAAEAVERFYADANPAWLAGNVEVDETVWVKTVNADGARLFLDGNSVWCRWWDMLDDATWFVNEVDAAALALLVDGQVVRALDTLAPNDSDRYLLQEET